jgi:hypothetical protein
VTELEKWFYERLGAHIEEYSYGQKTWQGFIWEMDLVAPDRTLGSIRRWKRRRVSYDTLANYVRCDYTDPDTGTSGSTTWASDSGSIARYGRKEEIIQRNLNSTNAAEARDEFLELFASGSPQLISFEKPTGVPFLEVTVAGYISTASFRHTATADGTTSDVGTWVQDILDTDLEFLTAGRVAANTRTIKQKLSTPTRALTVLEDLLTLRDGSGNRFNITTQSDSVSPPQIHYEQWTNTPVGSLRGGRFYGAGSADLETSPRIMIPGIYRDQDYLGEALSRRVSATNSFYATPADFLLETVEVDKEGGVVPRLGVYQDEEALRTFVFKEDD